MNYKTHFYLVQQFIIFIYRGHCSIDIGCSGCQYIKINLQNYTYKQKNMKNY